MLLSVTSRKSQPDADLHSVHNIAHTLVSNKQEGPATCWLTLCSKPRACSFQQQAGRVSHMLTYKLFKTQHAVVNNKQEGPARCWLTSFSKPKACSCQQAGRASQILTYKLYKTQSMLFSATSWKGQPDVDLHTVQNPEHALVSNKQEGPATCWHTDCWKPIACSCQQQAGRASHMVTYILFKTHSMHLSATSRKGQPHADLRAVENPQHALVSNKQEEPVTCWLTSCSNPEHALISNKQKGPATWWLTSCSKPRACSLQKHARRASHMVTYRLLKTHNMLLSATSRKGQPHGDLHPVQNP